MNTFIVAATVISALGGISGVVSAYRSRAEKRQIEAQARKLEVEPEFLLMREHREFTTGVLRRLKDADYKIERQETHIRALEEELRRHGITPPPWPPLRVVDDDAG